jgi:hypothetical protein
LIIRVQRRRQATTPFESYTSIPHFVEKLVWCSVASSQSTPGCVGLRERFLLAWMGSLNSFLLRNHNQTARPLRDIQFLWSVVRPE